jgi:hypothetical protein
VRQVERGDASAANTWQRRDARSGALSRQQRRDIESVRVDRRAARVSRADDRECQAVALA